MTSHQVILISSINYKARKTKSRERVTTPSKGERPGAGTRTHPVTVAPVPMRTQFLAPGKSALLQVLQDAHFLSIKPSSFELTCRFCH